MTNEERKEFDELVCGSTCFKRPCFQKRSASDYLVNSDGIFRCYTHSFCSRVTPHRGKIVKWVGSYDGNNDAFKISIINRKIKMFKNDLKIVKPMKLVTQKGRTWVEIDGTKISPRRFSQSWWTFKFEREERE